MKFKNNLLNQFGLIFFLFVSTIIFSFSSQGDDKRVGQAYQLRIEGKVDSAKTLLKTIIAEDSTNAMAWYELARTKHHMGLGNPRELMGSLEDIQNTIGKAVELDDSNEIYLFYNGIISYTRAYLSSMRGQPDAKEKVKKVISDFESVLNQKQDYTEAMLYLIEILSIPENMGGDSLKAEEYAQKLEHIDIVNGAKAKELLLPQEANRVEFWIKILGDQPKNPDVHEALGKAHLYEGNIEEAKKCFENAISLDEEKNYLHVDIGRYYLMQAMQNRAKLDSVASLIENEFETYKKSKPEPINPLRAFVIGKLADIKFRIGEEENGNKLREEAMILDPYYSKAFAIPSRILFDPPDKIIRVHEYFSRPF